jgi:hypothetical protein
MIGLVTTLDITTLDIMVACAKQAGTLLREMHSTSH